MTTEAPAVSASLAAEIRAEAARIGWSRREVARRADIPSSTLNRWLNGTTAMTVDDAAIVAAALGLSLSELTIRAEATQPRPMPDPHAPDTRGPRPGKGSVTRKRPPDGPRDFRYVTPPSMPNDRVKVAA